MSVLFAKRILRDKPHLYPFGGWWFCVGCKPDWYEAKSAYGMTPQKAYANWNKLWEEK